MCIADCVCVCLSTVHREMAVCLSHHPTTRRHKLLPCGPTSTPDGAALRAGAQLVRPTLASPAGSRECEGETLPVASWACVTPGTA